MKSASLRMIATAIASSAVAFAHYTWIAPAAALQAGKQITIQIGHGHTFPNSEEAIAAGQLDLFAVAPSGAKVKLQPGASASAVSATFTPAESGFHRIALIQDRGVSSRTPVGVKKGGRDQNPSAIQASRTLRTAVAYASTALNASIEAKPLGLEFELIGIAAKGGWSLQLLKQGKPVPGAAVEVFLAGGAKAVETGKTGPDGRVSFQPPSGAKGPAMFSVMFQDKTPGTNYDFTNYETSLYVNW